MSGTLNLNLGNESDPIIIKLPRTFHEQMSTYLPNSTVQRLCDNVSTFAHIEILLLCLSNNFGILDTEIGPGSIRWAFHE